MRHPGDGSITGVAAACAFAFWVSVAAAQVVPGDPSSSALPESPGATGTVRSGGAKAGSQPVIPVGPGPRYPRVPRGITQPPEPFGPHPGLGIEPLSPLPESERPLSGSFGVARLGDLEEPPTGLTIDQAIDRVLRINLELRAQAMEISKARADVLTAGLRGNPLIYLDSSLVPYSTFAGTAGGPTQYDVNITHPLDLNHKRRHRIEVAVRAQKVTEAQYQNAVRLQLDNLYTAWIDVLAAQATIRFIESGLESDRILVLGFGDLLGADGDLDPAPPLMIQVERMGDVDIALRRASRGAGEGRIGHQRRVHVDQGVPPQPGGEHVGPGLGDFHRLGPQFQVDPQDPVDRLVDRQPGGRSLQIAQPSDSETSGERPFGLGKRRQRLDPQARLGPEGFGGLGDPPRHTRVTWPGTYGDHRLTSRRRTAGAYSPGGTRALRQRRGGRIARNDLCRGNGHPKGQGAGRRHPGDRVVSRMPHLPPLDEVEKLLTAHPRRYPELLRGGGYIP